MVRKTDKEVAEDEACCIASLYIVPALSFIVDMLKIVGFVNYFHFAGVCAIGQRELLYSFDAFMGVLIAAIILLALGCLLVGVYLGCMACWENHKTHYTPVSQELDAP